MQAFILRLCVLFILQTVVSSYKVTLENNGPTVLGSNITYVAKVSGFDNSNMRLIFWDVILPQNDLTVDLKSDTATWDFTYSKDYYQAGQYTAKVKLEKYYFGVYIPIDTADTTFKLTDTLNGNLTLSQNNTERPNSFVAVNKSVIHTIKLPEKELDFLRSNSSSILTYWFIDCTFYGMTTEFSLNYTYTDVMKDHHLDVLVVANHKPLPPLPTTTTTSTTTTTTTTTTTSTTTTTTTTTTQKPTKPDTTEHPQTTTDKTPATTNIPQSQADNNDTAHKLVKRAASNKTFKKKVGPLQEFICKSSIVPIGDSYTYGHYQDTIAIREPIGAPVNITGLNWLQHEDLMNLDVKYTGSPPFEYCALYKVGQYNITGNETCPGNKIRTGSNNFPLIHYFSDTDQHTVVVIIENDLGKVVSRATINIYKVSINSQLSVIVVPVVFCLLAVILVVFGVAYYQHRSRHTIEVADFDFGQQARMDYKTFTERLRDSFRNAFNFGQHDDTDPLTANPRHDSMT